MKKSLLFLVVITLLIGCKKDEPTLQIKAVGNQFIANTEIEFVATMSDANSVLWEFGDGETSTELNPKHAFSLGGQYTVKCTAYGDGGNTTATLQIQVLVKFNKIKEITIISYPTPELWDPDSFADLYVVVTDSYNREICITKDAIISDAYFPAWWIWNYYAELPEIGSNYQVFVELRDDDGNGSFEVIAKGGVTVNGDENKVFGDDGGAFFFSIRLIN
jgi:PKD repeat protein